jgi:hypothetical protein
LRNLILVHHPGGQERRDFEEIAAKIAQIEPSIAVFIAQEDVRLEASGLPEEMWERPTLMISFQFPRVFRPKRGRIYAGRPLNKVVQIQRFLAAGVPTPRTATLPFKAPPPPEIWGRWLIVKPARTGLKSGGRHTFLLPAARVNDLAARLFPAGHPARTGPILAQRFVDTGEYPANFRVLCLLGEPLLCMEYRLKTPRPPLDAPELELLQAIIASNADGSYSHALVAPPEVLEFARRAAGAMPRIPLHGIDIIREAGTGKLFALESNPGGNTWHFSSAMSAEGRKEISREQRIAQFGAWDIAARVLAGRTMEEAD